MLDAAAPALALETVAVGAAFTPSSDEAAAAAPPVASLNGNTAPSNINIQTPIVINENGVATLSLTFVDPDASDTHTIFVDWKDGSTQTFNLAAGQTSFLTTHQYLDDNLPGPATEDYDVLVRVTDSAGEFSEVTSKITVNNVAPSNLQLAPITPVNENGVATLKLTFDDPGSKDTHTVEVNWGDGSAVQVYNVPTGDRSFTATHQYLDDNPTATPSDTYTVSVRLVDDDLGVTTATTTATVNNVAPSNVKVTPVASILAEGGQASLKLTFDDPGSQDTHQVEINWGDGNTTVTTAVGHSLNVNHTYGDNATYAIIVKVIDDDGGVGVGSAAALVSNVPPSNVKIDPIATIDENGVAVLKLTFDDPGTLDSHTVDVDWGDGTIETIAVAAGSRTLTATHQYLDDNPTGTSSDVYAVKVTVRDDDGGQATGNATVQVVNVPPSNVKVTPVANIVNEGSQVALTVTFDDAGSQDTHQVEINWGDGNTTVTSAVGHSLNVNHAYGDNGTYAINVKVIDDDGGVGFGSAAALVNNVPPSNVKIDPIAAINENGVATLTLTFDDPGTLDSHTVDIDWGDGTIETVAVTAGSRTLTATHQYLDDNPTGTSSDIYTVKATVRDDDGGQAVGNATVQVANVPPSNVKIDPIAAINENGVATLKLTFDDPGSLDSHTVDIDWGDGTVETVVVAAGSRTLTATHQYLDDNPTATSSDIYTVKATVRDDDGGQAIGNATVQVANVPPSNVKIDPIAAINENGVATLTLTFDDPGTLDSHTVDIDWGDGTVETVAVAAGSRTLTATHQYIDDNPTDTSSDVYTVTATVRDDDGGQAVGNATVQVNNSAPSNVQVTPVANIVDEGSQVALTVTFDDSGSQDTHQVEINWGDGNVTIASATGHTLNATHAYGDNGTYAITVKVTDDDGGVGFGSAAALVNNVPPSSVKIDPIAAINENGVATLTLTFDDPGSLDTHTVEIDWGDGTIETVAVAAGSRTLTATHQYLDDNPTGTASDVYEVKATVRDDDGGQAVGNATVQVNNVAPGNVVAAPVASIITEGSQVNLGVTFDDVGSQDTHQVEITWGDGHVTVGTATGHAFSANHTYADNGVYAVYVKVIDDDGGVGEGSAAVHVNNVAPTLTVPGSQTVNEGGVLSLPNIGQFTDPGFNNPLNAGNVLNGGETTEEFTYEINWGDGSANSTGAATIDQLGSPGAPTAGSFDGTHVYADNGVYTVTVTVRDDDGGVTTSTFQVTVLNVDPSLKFQNPAIVVNEGTPITLGGIGVGVTDPGFDNGAQGTQETFHDATVDWGDGTGPQSLTINNRVSGSPGVATTADFVSTPHVYADNGTYTVTVRFRDDDGGFVDRTFTITVENVAPSLNLTNGVFVIDEGQTLNLPNLGTFSDPGFNNPNNPNGASVESFYYTIDWGDGTTPQTGQLPASVTNGSPGTPTLGTLASSHKYADNDADNKYTITVTLFDDDGGSVTKEIEVTVRNVNPTLKPIVATDVNNKGETTLTLQFTDPGADKFNVQVDWGDGTISTYPVDVAGNGQTQVFMHKYSGPPDPLNPTGDITLTVQVFDDDFDTPGVVAIGASNIETVDISQPGLGAEKFRIDTSPQVAILTFPDRQVVPLLPTAAESRLVTIITTDDGGGGGDTRAASERYLELCVINPDGTTGQRFRLPSNVLNNLPALFKNLPDNHYVIYLVQSETNARRLVIDVFVRNGKLIDPGDDSEGARDRPPTEEATTQPAEEQPAAVPIGDEGAAVEPPTQLEPLAGLGMRPRSSTAIYHGATLAGVAIALSGAGKSSYHQMEEAIARAKPDQWKRLRSALTRPKKPR
ncbi:hypothetical protein PLANPX_5582 [Lacipirellula parvula]|uniref:PKD domain-containing protein n=2 Tax=Lacipirellula parvula TaxID=2650471 RepID=A0A5K7XGJ0_9BACT|nr:hypothetical protein PLANPX_5582 [Lacipirellula parvula]